MFYTHDVLIIGSGAAGLTLALKLAQDLRIAVISKGPLDEGSTLYAQGGVSAVLDQGDSLQAHVKDTLGAGVGLCSEQAVHFTVERGPECIQWLLGLGVPFTKETDARQSTRLHLTREGGHTHRRVVHADDATGLAIETVLLKATRDADNIELFEQHIAVDLITTEKLGLGGKRCLGAYVLDRELQEVIGFKARFVVLATGGASKVYLYTSNPDTSTGDGIAMAWRAGCDVANMEFMQFHPTCLYHPKAKSFLISEAVRGEGGQLLHADGTAFMHNFDPRGELAPRDIVARAIDHEMKRLGTECVYLDITHRSADFIKRHFPMIYERCLQYGFDMTQQPLPVVPAAHYTCGGVVTDLNGATRIDQLYAVGEVACTGLHGANRMASNSLLECLVFAHAAASHINAFADKTLRDIDIPSWDESRVTDSDEEVVVAHNWEELRHFMWDYVGIVRTTKRLQRAKRRIDLLKAEIHEYYSNFRISNDLIELRNLVVVAEIIVLCALSRHESRGLHYTLDYPYTDKNLDGVVTAINNRQVP